MRESFILAKVYPVRENAHIQMYLLLPLLNLIYINVITYCIIKKKIPLQSMVQHNEDIAIWFSPGSV